MYEIYQELLDKKGLKNSDVSRATGISNMTLSDWKRGKTKPKTENIRKLADFLGVSVDYLTTGKEYKYSIEMATIDVELSNMNDRLKEYALKLANLPKDKQEHVMELIDFLK